jgi:hypothetical protein
MERNAVQNVAEFPIEVFGRRLRIDDSDLILRWLRTLGENRRVALALE